MHTVEILAEALNAAAGLGYSVRRSETFFAYLTGKQSLFVDCFEGPEGCVVYEELPRARSRGIARHRLPV